MPQNFIASAAVRTRDLNKCFMSGRSNEGFQDYIPTKLSVAHNLPTSDEELVSVYSRLRGLTHKIWKYRYAFDSQGIMWQGPYVNSQKLDPAQRSFFYPALALLPHHPANNMLLIQEQHDHFDNFYSYICPWTKRVFHAVPLPQTCGQVMQDAKHGQLAAGSLDFRSGELSSPSLPALYHQASQVVNIWNRLWIKTAAVDNSALLSRRGGFVVHNPPNQTAFEDESLPPVKVNWPRQSLPSGPSAPRPAACARSLSVSSVDPPPRPTSEAALPCFCLSCSSLHRLSLLKRARTCGRRSTASILSALALPGLNLRSQAQIWVSPFDQHARLWQETNETEIRTRDMEWETPELVQSQQVEIGPTPMNQSDLKEIYALLRSPGQEHQASKSKSSYLEYEDDDQDDDFLEDWQREENFPPDEMDGIPWAELGEDLHAILEHDMRMASLVRKPRW